MKTKKGVKYRTNRKNVRVSSHDGLKKLLNGIRISDDEFEEAKRNVFSRWSK